jgi:PAS domain S-box-containing protein
MACSNDLVTNEAGKVFVRILCLEDQPEDVILCRRALEAGGYELVAEVVSTVEELMARVRAHRYDIILADYCLGVGLGTGLDALRLLKAEGWDIPFILVTGMLGEQKAVECLREGVTDYVLKHQLERLPSAVRRALAQKRLQEEKKRCAEKERAHLAAIVEWSYDAIVSSDPQGIVTTWNPAAEKMYGYTAQEALGRPMSLIIPPDRLHEMPVLAGKPERRQGVRQKQTFRRSKDGRLIPVLVTVSPVPNGSGEIVGASEIAHDITERTQMEAQLRYSNWQLEEQNRRVREADRMKSLFVANMSHEVRTPLNCMIGFAELLYDGKLGPLSEPHQECVGDILSAARQLLQLVNDILSLAKVESGTLEFRPVPVALDMLVNEVTRLLEAVARSKRIQIEKEVSPEMGVVTVDGGRVKQILHNYLSNALKFTAEGGRVTVRVRPEPPGRFRLEVEDNGIGIQPEDVGRLFTEFQQLDSGLGKMYQGTGLGLALTRRMVEAQGGEVGVRSTPGQGSTFHAVLPCVFQQKLAALDGETPQILVVASDPVDADPLAEMLAQAGLGVEVAPTPGVALTLSRVRRFAAILLLARSDTGGAELFREIRASDVNRNTPVVVVRAETGQEFDLGFPGGEVLSQPVASEKLIEALGRAGIQPPGVRDKTRVETLAGKELNA